MDVEGSWIRPAVVGNPEDEGSWGHWRRATKRKVKKRREVERPAYTPFTEQWLLHPFSPRIMGVGRRGGAIELTDAQVATRFPES